MQIDRFTVKAQEALGGAQQLAVERGNPQVETEHLLAALLDQEAGLTIPILERLGANHQGLRTELQAQIARLSTIQGASQMGLSPHLRDALEAAQSAADQMKDAYVSTEHVLMALAGGKDWTGDCSPATESPATPS